LSNTGDRSLSAGCAAPATEPFVSFERVTLGDGTAQVVSFGRGTYFQLEHGLGDGKPLTEYTLVLDVRLALEAGTYAAILQTNPQNDDPADWAAHPRRGVGENDYGGRIDPGRWYRLALVVDAVAKEMRSYIDGREVQKQRESSARRWALQSRALLFGDGRQHNSSGWVNSVQLRNYAMTATEVAALGGPTADGIPLP
jgi:hypothetical protein